MKLPCPTCIVFLVLGIALYFLVIKKLVAKQPEKLPVLPLNVGLRKDMLLLPWKGNPWTEKIQVGVSG